MPLARSGAIFGIPIQDVSVLLSRLLVATGVAGLDPSSSKSATPSQALPSPPELTLPDDGMSLLMILLTVALTAVGLLVLARLLVGEELFETGRWPSHRGF